MPGPGYYLIGKEEEKEVMDVLKSGHVSRYGDLDDPNFQHKAYTLEKEFSEYCGAKHTIATSSGTSSLFVPLTALQLEPGSEVLVPSFTFVATYTSVIYAGLIPILVEVDDSLTMDSIDMEKKITSKTKAIIPVHMMGNPCDLDKIMAIAKRHDLIVIEDCCQAAGGTYKGKKLGTYGTFGAFSLNIYKTITAGDGGLVITNDDALYDVAFAVHDQGHTPGRKDLHIGQRNILGQNFRINELTGAFALAQVRKLDYIIETLHTKKKMFKDLIASGTDCSFRTINDPGEVGAVLTTQFESAEKAKLVANELGFAPESESFWHVYSKMEHMMYYYKKNNIDITPEFCPYTNDILARSVSLSVGTVGGAGNFGITILSDEDEIKRTAERFIETCNKY